MKRAHPYPDFRGNQGLVKNRTKDARCCFDGRGPCRPHCAPRRLHPQDEGEGRRPGGGPRRRPHGRSALGARLNGRPPKARDAMGGGPRLRPVNTERAETRDAVGAAHASGRSTRSARRHEARRIKKLGCTPLCNAPPDCIEPLRRPPPALRTGMYILTGKVWEILTGKLRLQTRLLRGEISLRPGLPCEPVTPRAATAFRQDTAFGRDYYALKSHYVPISASRIALRTRHAARRDGFQTRYGLRSRLLRGEISLRPDHCAPDCPANPSRRAPRRLSDKIRPSGEIITR